MINFFKNFWKENSKGFVISSIIIFLGAMFIFKNKHSNLSWNFFPLSFLGFYFVFIIMTFGIYILIEGGSE